MLDSAKLYDAMVSHALASGYFETVNMHEPKRAPGNGLTAAVWLQRLLPVPRGSGLSATSVLVVFSLRIFQNMLMEPQDAIDPNMLRAVDSLCASYSGDFTLGGLIRKVDLLGSSGSSLSAEAGYIKQDDRLFRVMTLTVPLIVNDVWEQL